MKTTTEAEHVNCIETTEYYRAPVKIDEILEARMRAFLRARRVRQFTFLR